MRFAQGYSFFLHIFTPKIGPKGRFLKSFLHYYYIPLENARFFNKKRKINNINILLIFLPCPSLQIPLPFPAAVPDSPKMPAFPSDGANHHFVHYYARIYYIVENAHGGSCASSLAAADHTKLTQILKFLHIRHIYAKKSLENRLQMW